MQYFCFASFLSWGIFCFATSLLWYISTLPHFYFAAFLLFCASALLHTSLIVNGKKKRKMMLQLNNQWAAKENSWSLCL